MFLVYRCSQGSGARDRASRSEVLGAKALSGQEQGTGVQSKAWLLQGVEQCNPTRRAWSYILSPDYPGAISLTFVADAILIAGGTAEGVNCLLTSQVWYM